jgi:hypothetical protein
VIREVAEAETLEPTIYAPVRVKDRILKPLITEPRSKDQLAKKLRATTDPVLARQLKLALNALRIEGAIWRLGDRWALPNFMSCRGCNGSGWVPHVEGHNVLSGTEHRDPRALGRRLSRRGRPTRPAPRAPSEASTSAFRRYSADRVYRPKPRGPWYAWSYEVDAMGVRKRVRFSTGKYNKQAAIRVRRDRERSSTRDLRVMITRNVSSSAPFCSTCSGTGWTKRE